jgi:thiosulfate/3-mercaptopyruvate sulfurtransferase
MTNINIPGSLVSVHWLAENRNAENLVILDASIKIVTPVQGGEQKPPVYIPGALRFDIDHEMSDKTTSLPHMMPSPEVFTEKSQELGINRDSAIIAYDQVGIYSSPRAWCMFRAMGHEQVAVLDGGLPAWIEAGYRTVPHLAELPVRRGNFVSCPQDKMFVDSAYVLKALNNPTFSVIDARSEGRFKGLEPEPREGLRRGHMPNAVNIPFTSVLENGKMSSKSKLQSIFEKYKDKHMIFSCGSGLTACVTALAAEQAGYENLYIYDGSWSEWGLPFSGLPVEPG